MVLSAKVVLLVMGVVCALVTPQVATVNAGVMEECSSETGVTKKNLLDFMKGENDSREVKCFFKCMMTAYGTMNEDGTYNMETMKHLTPSLYETASTTCADFQEPDLCDKAYAHVDCLRKNKKEEFEKLMQIE